MRRRDWLAGMLFAPRRLRLAWFRADVTPKVGATLYTGPARSIADPLDARGFVLFGAGEPLVLVSIDWCEIRNSSYALWRRELAAAAGTTPERVLLTCVHQHDAPYTDSGAQSILEEHGSPDPLFEPAFETEAIRRVTAALKAARPRRVTHIGSGQARVEQVASNRRYVLPDGKVSYGRTSATRDPAIRAMPEGLIDPWLKTITFFDGAKPLVALHCYSTHPMSYYGKGDVSWDFPGIARARIDGEIRGVFHIYASGCSGDTMAGRYNDGAPSQRPVLAGRLATAMAQAFAAASHLPLGEVRFRAATLQFAPRHKAADLLPLLRNPATPRRQRLDAALGLSWLARIARPIDVPCLDFGPICLTLLPGEAFVQYQLWAQQERPQSFVMAMGYGECAPGYIPTSADVRDGYDDHYGWAAYDSCEPRLRQAIREALGSDHTG